MKRAFLVALVLAFCAAGADAPHRIVSLSPNLTEMLYGIGAFDAVVAVSDFCTYPPQVKNLPSIGAWDDPNLEKLVALRPDVVFIDDAQSTIVQDNFKKLGFRVIIEQDHTIQEVYHAMSALGQATGHAAEATKLVATTREGLDRISRKTAPLPKPKVVLIVDRTPGTLRDLYTANAGGFLGELVAIAGGRMAGSSTPRGYERLSAEDLLAMNPDVIIEFIHGVESRFSGDPMESWKEMPELKAVRAHRIHGLTQDYVPHASQRMVQTAELFLHLIHPELK